MIVALPAFFTGNREDKWDILNHFQDGKDFQILNRPHWWVGGPYFSIRDKQAFMDHGIRGIHIPMSDGEEFLKLIF